MRESVNKVANKLSYIKRKNILNMKNMLLNGVASSIFTPPPFAKSNI